MSQPLPTKRPRTSTRSTPTKLVSGLANRNIKMPYFTAGTLDVIGGGLNYVTMRGNGPYDPDAGLGGHQPMGWDQYSALYKMVYAKGSTIRVRANDVQNTTQSNSSYILVWADTSPNTPASYEAAMEVCAAHGGKVERMGSTYLNHPKIKLSALSKRMLDKGFSDPQACSSVDSTPVAQWYWHVVFSSVTHQSGDTLIRKVEYTVDLLYDCLFFDSKELGQS